jgi:hypothetical protein
MKNCVREVSLRFIKRFQNKVSVANEQWQPESPITLYRLARLFQSSKVPGEEGIQFLQLLEQDVLIWFDYQIELRPVFV